LLEEVHLAIRVTELLTILPMITNRAYSQGIVIAYHAEAADPNATALHCDDDVCDAGWFAPHELPGDLAFTSTQLLLKNWVNSMATGHG
jgi:hypothetical protein